ncbi:MAG: arsenosugar biosynthesis radical SAM (seleno)protein ArsS [Nitrospirota bacterium]
MDRLSWEDRTIKKAKIEIIQINLGNRGNQRCIHCHIGASPAGGNNMDSTTARKVLEKLIELDSGGIEFTGGAPELNPNLKFFLEELSGRGKKTAVRTNLTVLDLPEYSSFIDIYRRCGTRVIASFPGCFKEMTDRQRGKGVFEKSIRVLRRLNDEGYGSGALNLDLVYNPEGNHLPPSQEDLEKDYRKLLKEMHGISFSRLITITNTPIGGFKAHLVRQGRLDEYMKLLVNNFNPATLDSIMCRELLSVDHQGRIYDCDFNLALGIRVAGYEDRYFWDIDFSDFYPVISCGDHCYACTVNRGSSCHGVLISDDPYFDVKEAVKHYYGTELTGTSDLKTSACCTTDSMPLYARQVLPYIAEEIKEKYYGCGSPIPVALSGMNVLDIGCGTGRDCYILSKLVGENGFVTGIDMTEKQIEVADKYVAEHAGRFGYNAPNVKFICDDIENILDHFPEGSLDLIISNCVVNLVEEKEDLIRKIYRILKPGGEFFFSDIYADRRLPDELRRDPVLYGECLGGALYRKDFERIARRSGFTDPRVVSRGVVDISNNEIKNLVQNITFYSITYRLWKLEGLEEACEDFGHVAVYKGGIPESPFNFVLDETHIFEKDRPERVCGNTALMLAQTRFRDYFSVTGSFDRHFGAFTVCGTTAANEQNSFKERGSSCC